MSNKQGERYSEEFRRDAVALARSSGKTVTGVARDLDQVTDLQEEITTGCQPWTYALRCVGHRCPISPHPKVKKTKNPQVRGLTWGFTLEPPSGFEPETYALRVRCSGQLS